MNLFPCKTLIVVLILFGCVAGNELYFKKWANCSFETGNCHWREESRGDTFWKRTIATKTAPFRKAAHGEHYMLANLTGSILGTKAVLTTPPIDVEGNICVRFYLIVAVQNSFMLTLNLKPPEEEQSISYNLHTFDANVWNCLYAKLPTKTDTRILFEIQYIGGSPVFLAIDDFQIFNEHLCNRSECESWDSNELDTRFTRSPARKEQPPSPPLTPTPPLLSPDNKSSTSSIGTKGQQLDELEQRLPLYVGVPFALFIVIILVVLGLCVYRSRKQKAKKKMMKDNIENIHSRLGFTDTTKIPSDLPSRPLSEEDEYGYMEIQSTNSDDKKSDFIAVQKMSPSNTDSPWSRFSR